MSVKMSETNGLARELPQKCHAPLVSKAKVRTISLQRSLLQVSGKDETKSQELLSGSQTWLAGKSSN